MEKIITVDGFVATGKTTLCQRLARRIGWDWVSTGIFYRGLAYMVLDLNLNTEQEWLNCIEKPFWKVRKSMEKTRFFYKDRDITLDLTQPKIDRKASDVARVSKVRQALIPYQREQKDKNKGLLAEGRDCGSVIFPQAEIKIYLTASGDVRAGRRAKERNQVPEEVMEAQQLRDQVDLKNTLNPNQNPEGIWTIQTDQSSLDEIENKVIEKAKSIFKF